MNSTRLLTALFVIMAILPLTVSVFEKTASLTYDHREISDEIAMEKLRRIYLLSYEREIEENSICLTYQDRQFELGLINSKLILSPGTQIYLDEVDTLSFREKEGIVFIEYERGGKHYERVLGKAERLHLDDFSLGDECSDRHSDESSLSDEDVTSDT